MSNPFGYDQKKQGTWQARKEAREEDEHQKFLQSRRDQSNMKVKMAIAQRSYHPEFHMALRESDVTEPRRDSRTSDGV